MEVMRVLGWTVLTIPVALVAVLSTAYWMSDNQCGEAGARPPANPVTAVVYCDYGSPDVLELEAIERPVPGDDEVLVRVHAAAANPLDWHYMRGTPYIMRLGEALRCARDRRLQHEKSSYVPGASLMRL